MLYEIKQGESIYDVALKLYGDANYCVKLVEDNSDLDLSTSDIANIIVEYDEQIKIQRTKTISKPNVVVSDKKPNYKVKTGQSIYDLSIMYGYGVEGVVNFSRQINNDSVLIGVENAVIDVAKIKTNISEALFLQNKILATNVGFFGIQTDGGDYIATDSGLIIGTT